MEELHTDSIDGGHEGQLWARSRARERAYSNNCKATAQGCLLMVQVKTASAQVRDWKWNLVRSRLVCEFCGIVKTCGFKNIRLSLNNKN
jgi:hypothetical protein